MKRSAKRLLIVTTNFVWWIHRYRASTTGFETGTGSMYNGSLYTIYTGYTGSISMVNP